MLKMKSLIWLYLFVTTIIKLSNSQLVVDNGCKTYSVETSTKFEPVSASIGGGDRHIFCYKLDTSLLPELPGLQLQFYAEAVDPNTDESPYIPLHATAYWLESARFWTIPVHLVNTTTGLEIGNLVEPENVLGKTLWLYPKRNRRDPLELKVEISALNTEVLINYTMKIVVLENFLVKSNKEVKKEVATPSSPSFFMFNTSALDWQFVFIDATSSSLICTRMIIRKLDGPFLDPKEDPGKGEFGQTFTLQSGLSFWMNQFPNGFILVFQPFVNDLQCHKLNDPNVAIEDDNPYRRKDIRFKIKEGMPYSQYFMPMLFPLIIIVFVMVVSSVCLHISTRNQCNLLMNQELIPIKRKNGLFISNITINDLIIEETSRVEDQSQRYCGMGFVGSGFYCIPVFIFIIYIRERFLESGNLDLCTFNQYCSHMMGTFHDFNHMYSNIGYVTLGPYFALLVRYRQYCLSRTNIAERQSGVMVHYPLLYCMALIITMTGVMSGTYHICPNPSNFTFDTVFMYTTAAIAIVTVHQLRHPTYLSANFTFAALVLVGCSTVLGLLWEQYLVRVCFTFLHVVFLVTVLLKLWFHGYVRRNGQLVHNWRDTMYIILIKLTEDLKHGRILSLQTDVWTAPNDPDIQIVPGPGRLVVPGFFFVVNTISLLAIWTVLSVYNFATQMLFICVLNASLYLIFYCAVKFYHGECCRILWIQPGLYLAISATIWAIGITFFSHQVSTWESSPAESRVINEDCILMGFYDYHDMWHFLSSLGLFTTAMLMLTVDDDLVNQPRTSIPVF